MLTGGVWESVGEGSVPSIFFRLVGGNNKEQCSEGIGHVLWISYTQRDKRIAVGYKHDLSKYVFVMFAWVSPRCSGFFAQSKHLCNYQSRLLDQMN